MVRSSHRRPSSFAPSTPSCATNVLPVSNSPRRCSGDPSAPGSGRIRQFPQLEGFSGGWRGCSPLGLQGRVPRRGEGGDAYAAGLAQGGFGGHEESRLAYDALTAANKGAPYAWGLLIPAGKRTIFE